MRIGRGVEDKPSFHLVKIPEPEKILLLSTQAFVHRRDNLRLTADHAPNSKFIYLTIQVGDVGRFTEFPNVPTKKISILCRDGGQPGCVTISAN